MSLLPLFMSPTLEIAMYIGKLMSYYVILILISHPPMNYMKASCSRSKATCDASDIDR